MTGASAQLDGDETPDIEGVTPHAKETLAWVRTDGAKFGIDEFRQVIHGRLYKLDPFRYELVDIPFKFHHPMWRETLRQTLEQAKVGDVVGEAADGRTAIDAVSALTPDVILRSDGSQVSLPPNLGIAQDLAIAVVHLGPP